MRQAVFIALGLALGIGLVITVTSAATGVQNAQAAVLHSLYGVGTDLTVTQPPKQGSGAGLSFGFKQQIKQVRSGQTAAGTNINDNELQNTRYATARRSSRPTSPGGRAFHPPARTARHAPWGPGGADRPRARGARADRRRLSSTEIAGKLVMSVPTAKTHVSRILAKLAARDRAQLVVIAYRSGLVKA